MQKFEFSFTANEVNLILSALGELPAKVSIDLIQEIKAQANTIMQEQNNSNKKQAEN